MHPFCIDDIVVCVDDTPLPGRLPPPAGQWIRNGGTYRVEAVLQDDQGCPGVCLAGISSPTWYAFHAWRFRRIELADEDFRLMLREVAKRQFVRVVADTIRTTSPSGIPSWSRLTMTRMYALMNYRQQFGTMPPEWFHALDHYVQLKLLMDSERINLPFPPEQPGVRPLPASPDDPRSP